MMLKILFHIENCKQQWIPKEKLKESYSKENQNRHLMASADQGSCLATNNVIHCFKYLSYDYGAM